MQVTAKTFKTFYDQVAKDLGRTPTLAELESKCNLSYATICQYRIAYGLDYVRAATPTHKDFPAICAELTKKLGRKPKQIELAKALGVSRQRAHQIYQRAEVQNLIADCLSDRFCELYEKLALQLDRDPTITELAEFCKCSYKYAYKLRRRYQAEIFQQKSLDAGEVTR